MKKKSFEFKREYVLFHFQQVIITKVDYDVNSDYLKMDVILKNNTNAIPSVDLTADLLVDLVDNIYVKAVKFIQFWSLIV